MRNILIALFILGIVGCKTTQERASSTPVIIADGTEVKQFENLMFCGDAKGYVASLAKVGEHLSQAWNESGDKDSSKKCSVNLKVDDLGMIKAYKLSECEDKVRAESALKIASPIPVSPNQCFHNAASKIGFELKKTKKS
ncbi:hypothetical protein [Aliikangiella sp. IMCC44632]